jgi:hypothetical protein
MKKLKDVEFNALQGFCLGIGLGSVIALITIDVCKCYDLVFPSEHLLKIVCCIGVYFGIFTASEVFFDDEDVY